MSNEEKIKKISNSINNTQLLVVIAMFVGFLLRMYNLGVWNLSSDEAFCVRVAGLNYIDIVKASIDDVHPPFYYFLFHNWINLFGNSEFASRSFSVLFGVLSIYLVYLLGKTLFNKWTGVISAIILSISTFAIDYSQKARMYTLLLFLSLCSVYLYSYIIKKINSNLDKKYYYGLLFINIFLLYTHIYGMFVIMFEFFWLLVLFIKYRNWGNIKNIFYSIFASSVVFIPWIFAILRAKAERSEPWLDLPNLLDILERFSGNYFMLALFVPFFITPIFWKKIRNTEVAFLYVLIFFTVLVPYLISLIIYPAFQARYVIFASAIFYLIIAYSFNNIKSNFAKLNIAIWFFVISFILMGEYYNGPDNVDWRSATAYLDKQATSSDLLIFSAGYTLKNGFNYYSHRDDLNKIPFPKLSERISLPVDEKNILELDDPLNKNYKNIYVIYHEHRDYNDMILKKIEDYGYVYDSDKEFNGMQIFEFVKSDD